MTNKYIVGVSVCLISIGLAGCQQIGKENTGILAGGATGALVGSALTDASPIGVAVGAVGGALAGKQIAKDMK